MSDLLEQLFRDENADLQDILKKRYEKTREIAAKEVRELVNDRLRTLPGESSGGGRETGSGISQEKISFLAHYMGCSEKTVERQLKCGTVQTQQKPGRDFAIKLAFALNLSYRETQGLLAKTAHPLLKFSDTTPEALRDLIIFKWLEADESDIPEGTRLSRCLSELMKNDCAVL